MAVDKDADRIRGMFAAISPRYDLLNHVLSLNLDRRWRRRTVRALDLAPGAQVLDVCTGTADLALELARAVDPRRGGRVFGTDFTPEMVRIGECKRRSTERAALALAVADTLRLPFSGERFDAVTVAFGIRNVVDRARALEEIARVLKPGGRLAILEFSTPNSRLFRHAYHAYFHRFLPRIGGWISGSRAGSDAYRYLPDSVGEFPPPDALVAELEDAGFEAAQFRRLSFGVAAIHLARRRIEARAPRELAGSYRE